MKTIERMKQDLGFEQIILPFFQMLRGANAADIARLRSSVLEERGKFAHSGTTIVGFMYSHGIVMAADRQTSFGWHKSIETVKLKQVGTHSVIGMAGMCACIQETERQLVINTKHLAQFLEKDLYIEAQGKLLERILKANFLSLGFLEEILGYIAVPILGGVNPQQQIACLYSFDGAGAITDLVSTSTKYDSVGSGSLYAKTVLDRKWKAKCTEEEALLLAVEAVYAAGSRDMGSAPAHIAPPTVAFITTDGVAFVPQEKTIEIATNFYIDDLVRRGGNADDYVIVKPIIKKEEKQP